MKTRNLTGPTMAALVILLFIQPLYAQHVRTGTNINSKSIPSEILVLQQPDEVGRIRQLLVDGRKNDALVAAEAFLAKIDRVTLRHESTRKYYAWNAYCTVLTSLQRVEEAITACDTAISFESGKWSAVNNRGTAKLVGGLLDEALSDYEAALAMVDEGNSHVRETILHNIALVEQRR